MRLTRALLLGTTFAVAASITGCGTTGEVGGDFETPLPGGGSLTGKFRVSINGDTSADVDATKPVCIEVCFSGADGADLGCVTIEVPGSAQVPKGAVRWEASIVDCPEGGSGGGGGGMFDPFAPRSQAGGGQQGQKLAVPCPATQWELLGGSIFPIADGSTNVSYSFHINAASLAHAKARRDMVLAGGIGTPVGTGFDVIFYNESEAEFDSMGVPTGVRMRQAEVNDDFTTYRLTVNGQSFAELGVTGNLLHYGSSNGWNVVETFVPTSAFDTTPGTFDNQAEADWTSINTVIAWRAMQRVFAD